MWGGRDVLDGWGVAHTQAIMTHRTCQNSESPSLSGGYRCQFLGVQVSDSLKSPTYHEGSF